MTETALLSLSPKGEMAVIPHAPQGQHISFHGTLATAPLAGGAPREIAEDIEAADWAPHGSGLLLVRVAGGKRRLEFPAGKVLVETEGWISHPRFSPDGDRIAYLDHPVLGDDLGSVVMIDLAGKKSTLSAGWEGAEGLAWSPDGKEVWFTASKVAGELSLYAVGRSGRERSVLASPVGLLLYDISRDGAILLGRYEDRVAAFAGAQGEARERDLSWLDATMVRDISQDGKTILLTDFSAQSDYGVGLRKTDGSPVVSLGHGSAIALSPDGKLALTVSAFAPQKWSVVPTGAGDSHSLPMEGLTNFQSDGAWLPDSRRLIVVGAAAGQKMRTWLTDVAGVKPRPITPEGITGTLLSPDGRSLAAGGTDGKLSLYPMEGGEPAAVQGLKDGDQAIRWSSDGRSLYVVERGAGPTRIIRLEIATGKRELWKEITPADPAGLRPGSLSTVITPDGKSWAYTTMRILSRLYLVEGLK